MNRYGIKSKWEQARDDVESEAIWLGRDYMEGRKSINQVENYLNRESHYTPHFTRSQIAKHINKGATISEKEGKAKTSRVQPEQEVTRYHPKRKLSEGGKLASRPEHTRYKPPTREQKREQKGTRAYAARPKALNTYDVKTQRKRDLKVLLDKHTRGQSGVREVKRESKAASQGKAYKNVTYNETHHRYVGKNRLGAPPKKEWDYQPARKRKVKSDSKYLFTYEQGGAKNKQVTISAKTKEQAKSTFKTRHPNATHVDIRLVMQGE